LSYYYRVNYYPEWSAKFAWQGCPDQKGPVQKFKRDRGVRKEASAMNVSQIYDAETDPVEMKIELEKAAN
jgi:hypothetical protein